MTTILVTRREDGRLGGKTERDHRAWNRLTTALKDLAHGELLRLEYWFPRSPKFHRLHFAMLGQVFEAQEQFEDAEMFRKWVEVGGGFCEFRPGPHGKMVAIPKSIAYHAIDDESFANVHEKCKAFLLSERARRYLWPHLSDEASADMMESLIGEFL